MTFFKRGFFLSLACALCAGTIAHSGPLAALQPPPCKRVVTLSATPGAFSEPAVAIYSRDPRKAFAAYQELGNVAYTTNRGATWRVVAAVPPDHRLVAGDVSTAYLPGGRAVLCYIAFDRLGTGEYWAHDATRNGIYVVRSPDGGAHWERREIAVKSVTGHPNVFEDKPYVIADDTDGPFRGNLYIGWTEFHLAYSQMLFSRSTDGGATWSRPVRISTHNGLPRDDNGAVEGFDAAVARDGSIFAVWQDGTHVLLAVSRDGGRTFSPERPIAAVPSMNFSIDGYLGRGGNGFPQIAIDPAANRLFVTWSDYRNGEVDVFAATSTDDGATWSSPVKVNDDPAHDGKDHLFSWLAVDPANGDAYVLFKDRRGDPANVRETVTLARSANGGRSFRNYAWTSAPDDPLGQFMGDYTGLAAYDGRVYGVWTEAAPTKLRAFSRAWMRARTIVRLGIAQFRPARENLHR